MKDFIKWMDNTPYLLKIIFSLPGLGLIWGIYRLCHAIVKGNTIELVLAIILLIAAPVAWWVVDLIAVIFTGHIFWFK